MWQCVRIPSGLISKALDIDYAWCEEGKIWFLGQKLSYLFCADIDKKEIDIVSEIPYKDFARAREYIQTIKYKNKLICLPSMAKDILIYDLQNSNIKNLIIRGYENVEQLWCKSAGIVDDKIYIVERTNNCIIILDMFEENISDIITIRCLEKDDIVGEQSAIYKGNLYIPIATQQKIVSFDIYTCVFNEHYVKGSICGCRSICHDGRDCWIIGEHYGIVKWNPVTDEMTDVGNISENFNVFSIDWNKKRQTGMHIRIRECTLRIITIFAGNAYVMGNMYGLYQLYLIVLYRLMSVQWLQDCFSLNLSIKGKDLNVRKMPMSFQCGELMKKKIKDYFQAEI